MIRKFYKEKEKTNVAKRTIWASEENEAGDLGETGSHEKVVSGVRCESKLPIMVTGNALVQ
jgi:hypothetical protein